QVDKLARFLFLCKDFIRLARKPQYQSLFKNIDVVALEANSGEVPAGLSKRCFVHAETQQILHYEQHPHQPAPRCIGCSKSACYLCDLLIAKQNRYRISHAHRRLYEKWTIPDIGWMSEDQAAVFATVIQDMIQELTAAIRLQQTGVRAWMAYPFESRAFLPLSSGSTASKSTVRAVSSGASSGGTVRNLQSA
ncbi:hypothetical protein B0T11DRAFT_356185, partial [Plectosphaerella cucumerina]